MLLATAAAYFQGLDGPWVLDDEENLAPAIILAQGNLTFADVMGVRHETLFGRPLSHLSFVYSALVLGTSPEAFRIVNLILHLLCGLLVFRIVGALARHDPSLAGHQVWLAVVVAGLWLSTPMFVSTVLYAVQRMTQLSALFTLLSLLFFIEGRERLANGQSGAGWHLFVGMPLCLMIGMLAKENAAVVVGLLVLIELFFFDAKALGPGATRVLYGFFGLFALAPLIAGSWYFLTHLSSLLGGYSLRNFSLIERLLTEPRVLWDYVNVLLLPSSSRMGLIHDDYIISQGLLNPWTTGVAIIGWAGLLLVSVVKLRHSRPSIPFGLAFFLIAHGLESSFLPLEIYFEHRNYVPALGLYLAAASAALAVAARLPNGRAIVRGAAIAIIPIFLLSTTFRAISWRLHTINLILALEEHPNSPRLLSGTAALLSASGNSKDALKLARHAARVAPEQRAAMLLLQLGIHCTANQSAPESLFVELRSLPTPILNGPLLYQFQALIGLANRGLCRPEDLTNTSNLVQQWIDQNRQHEYATRIANVTYYLAQLMIAQGRDQEALRTLEAAIKLHPWVAGRHFLLADQYLGIGDLAAARLSFRTGERLLPPGSRRYEYLRFAMRHRLGLPAYD